MTPLKVLHLCHNHPALHPGGTEIFALDLHRQLNADGEVDGLFIGCVDQNHRRQRPGTVFQGIGPNSNEMLMWTGHFDRFYLSQIDLHGIVPELTDLLVNLKPDIVHFHHILLMGAEILFLVRRILPKAKIVMSLHDYYSICANDGQMVTTGDRRLCHQASPDACHRCFPQLEPEQFVLRERHLKTHFSVVDRFLSPSNFLRRRYIAWGIAADRIEVLRNARPEQNIVPHRILKKGSLRGNFAYFGNLSPNKGVLVLLEAARLLHQRHPGAFRLDIHGGAPFQSDAFKADLAAALARVDGYVGWHGAYRAEEMSDLMRNADWMVTPSIWWENAPLVIDEAFAQRRPVIASDMGGMAESVTNGVDGLTFRPGDASALADVMERALTEPQLWDDLVAGIKPRRTLEDCADEHLALYRRLLAQDEVRNEKRAAKAGASRILGNKAKTERMVSHVG